MYLILNAIATHKRQLLSSQGRENLKKYRVFFIFWFSGKLLKPITYSQGSIVGFSLDTAENSCS